MALQAPPELIGMHTDMPATVPADVAKALQFGEPPPSGLSADERGAWDQLDFFYKHGLGYAQEMMNRPQTRHGIAMLASLRVISCAIPRQTRLRSTSRKKVAERLLKKRLTYSYMGTY